MQTSKKVYYMFIYTFLLWKENVYNKQIVQRKKSSESKQNTFNKKFHYHLPLLLTLLLVLLLWSIVIVFYFWTHCNNITIHVPTYACTISLKYVSCSASIYFYCWFVSIFIYFSVFMCVSHYFFLCTTLIYIFMIILLPLLLHQELQSERAIFKRWHFSWHDLLLRDVSSHFLPPFPFLHRIRLNSGRTILLLQFFVTVSNVCF